ncbi:uncharacterized protein LOC113773851 [Coffea eugenioides]|uniref:uncharacterized protein LOC113773851 n=1 Tax=Coffea eugenioides TaxID=49369 RepID=UPI000F6098EE|nr:uncharacterized protein LOC113773851 [Coffea eugenioides]
MDRNATRRKKYAEMPPLKKKELLQRRRENRSAKKKDARLLPRIRKVPLGYIESGVSFPDSHHEKFDCANDPSMHSEMLGSEALKSGHDSAVTEALQYMSSRESASFVPHVHFASTTEIANDMRNASVFQITFTPLPTGSCVSISILCKWVHLHLQSAEFPLAAKADLRNCKGKFLPEKRKNLTLSSSSIEPDFCLPRRKIRNSVPVALHERPDNCFDRSHNVIQDLNSTKEDLLMNCLFENSIEYCSSDHVSVNSEKFYPFRATVHVDPFRQQKNASIEEQNFMLRSACSVPVMSIDRTTSSSHLFENVVKYSPLAKVYMQFGQPLSPFAYEHQRYHCEKNVPSSENTAFKTASTSQETTSVQVSRSTDSVEKNDSVMTATENARSSAFSCKTQPFTRERCSRRRVRKQALAAPKRGRQRCIFPITEIPHEALTLPDAPDCEHCGVKRFHLEPPNFCCSGGEILIVAPSMPYDLKRLFIENDEESAHFRNNVRTYNSNLGFTSFAARYDPELTKNTKGVYTFCVQGQVYHFLNSLQQSSEKPSRIQFYFFDSDEELAIRVGSSDKLRKGTLKLLMRILSNNPYAKFFKNLRNVPNIDSYKIVLNCYPDLDQRVYNLPTVSQVAAIWTEDDDESADRNVHIQVYTHSNTSHRIKHYYGYYDPLQYPILFPQGECGWHHGVKKLRKRKRNANSCEADFNVDLSSVDDPSHLLDLERRAVEHGKSEEDTVSAREYYCYRFQIRENDESMLLHCLRLLQQFSVDSYVKIETSRLDFHRHRQNVVRSEILQGVLDSVSLGQTEGSKVGRRIVLPAFFIGGPRDMRRRYLDVMALIQKYGKPDIFLTMTCNPAWKEIQCNLKYHEKPQDRPDFLARVFRAKFEMVKHELLNKQIFGEVAACVYVIEFQKRGFSHAHLLLILKSQFKLLNPESYDKVVCTELPDRLQYPHLYSLVVKHMIHGPCGDMDKSYPCMKDGSCKNHYPKNFCPHTTHGEDSYPYYRRKDDGKKVKVRRFTLDNRWLVPYNPYLLALFDCHMNVEICSTIKLVKYLYKYVFKGHDLVCFRIMADDSATDTDEIKEFQKGRYISPPEAFWLIYEFRLNEMTPSVYTLQVHLPNQQLVSFPKNSDLLQLLAKVDFSKTMLTEFLKMNASNATAENLKCFYKDFPQHFVWSSKYRHWTERKRRKVIGRLVSVNSREGERYYLRLLLNHIPGPISFDDLLTVHATKMKSFREAALALGLLQSDTYIEETLEEAVTFQMPSSLRLLFATLLVYCSPIDPTMLWRKFELDFSRDYERHKQYHAYSPAQIRGLVLADINKSLQQMGTSIAAYQLPLDELQKYAYDIILQACFTSQGHSFFIDGPGGTGKTFLYRSLLATLRSQGYIATSGIVASILPGGRIVHSRFKIPIDFSKNRACQLSKQGSVARLLSESKLILWDKASMAKRETIEPIFS